MKKKILLFAIIMAMLVCVFAISASADNIVKSSSDEFGELTIFDEAIGNTGISQLKDDGTIARTVLFDGTNYYTVPTTYILTESPKNQSGKVGEMLYLSFGELGTKLGASFNKNSIIRFEFPSDIAFICRSNENLSGCANVVEIIVNNGLRFWENSDQMKVFTNCKKLKSIDVSGMIMEYPKATFAMFEYCESLEYVKLPDSYKTADGFITYTTDHMFSCCKKLAKIENYEGFFEGNTKLSYKTFYNCELLHNIELWDGLQTIEGRAFGNCKSITSVVIPDSVTVIGTTETVFESCINLKKIVLPKKVSLGSYCFEKCTGLTDVWMPTESSTFSQQVFGQCGGDLNVTFHFATASSTITISNSNNNKDPFISAINKDGDSRIVYNVPLSTKCIVFLGGHKLDLDKSNPCAGICGGCGEATLAENPVHNYVTTIVYENYLAKGVKTQVCQNEGCAHNATPYVTDANPIITEFKGFSVSEKCDGITFGYSFDKDAIAEFEAVNGKIELGFLVAAKALLGENAPLNDDGTAATDKVVKA
ncbi:MAG: leucine-rich repeat protein, partial [Clostridia bacterium]|nr:leucine-rich repeat protein [Clostridia bacterium]